jgi:hypothetical protein
MSSKNNNNTYRTIASNRPTKPFITQMSYEEITASIKNVAKNIRESSARTRETVRTLRRSGAIEELTQAFYEAVIATRDTAKEINDASKDLKERGIIEDTVGAIEETTTTALETVQTVRDIKREAVETSTPQIIETSTKKKSKKRKEAKLNEEEEQPSMVVSPSIELS